MNARQTRGGFTLTELMVASTISSLLVLSLVNMFVQQRRAYKSMQLINEMEQNVRVAADMVARDTRMAGYGLSMPLGTLSSWITWVSGISNYVQIVQGAVGGRDRIHLVAAAEAPVGALASAAAAGSTTLTLASGEGARLNTYNKKVIFVGKTESARVVSISGDTLTISTDATASGVGLRYSYPAGAVIELIKVITYDWKNDPYNYPYVPHLRRDDSTGSFSYEWQKITASHIEDFQANSTTGGVAIAITGRSSRPDANYLHPQVGDRYRRRTVEMECRIRRPLQ